MDYKTLQEGIFLWVYKMKQPYSEVMNMPYHKAKTFMEFYMKYQKDLGDALEKGTKKAKSSVGSKPRHR